MSATEDGARHRSWDPTPCRLSHVAVVGLPRLSPTCSEADLATFGGRGTWKDEELWNYEAGVESTFLGKCGRFNASDFYMDIRNLQTTLTAGTCWSRIIVNVPAARPTTFLDFAVSAGVADARLQSPITSTDVGVEAGRRPPTTPRFQAAAPATWRWLAGGGWVAASAGPSSTSAPATRRSATKRRASARST